MLLNSIYYTIRKMKKIETIKNTNEIMNTTSKTDDPKNISPKSISKVSNNLFSNLFAFNGPIPRCVNLLNNYGYIQYQNILIPRFPFPNDYHFNKYKQPFNELLEKIKIDCPLTKNFISQDSNKNNFKNSAFSPYNNIYHKINIINNVNNKINDDNIIIDVKNDNNKIENNNFDEINYGDLNDSNFLKDDNFENTKIMNSNDDRKILKKIFSLQLYDNNKKLIIKKRGRKSSKKTILHVHTASDDDNILRKIQVHFLTFLVSFTNDYIGALFPKTDKKHIPFFRHFDYKLKRIINHGSIEKMKSSSIGDILQMQASPKNKTCVNNINQIIYMKLCQQFPELRTIYFNKKFKEFFVEYYYNKNDRTILLNGLIINLSNKTQTFNTLIQKNKNNMSKFKTIATYFYINNINGNKEEDQNEEGQMIQKQKPFFIID